MGADRIMFSVDWPFAENLPGTKWLNDLQISTEDKIKLQSGNAKADRAAAQNIQQEGHGDS